MTTIGDWLHAAQDLEPPEAELLLGHVLDLTRAQILIRKDTSIGPEQLQQLNDLAAQRRGGKPYAYIVGEQEFWSLTLQVSPAVLIPRPETELLVELITDQAAPESRVLDLGTGSGAIAIAVAHSRPDLRVSATDISSEALAVAQENAKRHKVAISFHQSHWFADITGQWRIIVSNPPYIAAQDPHLEQLRWEPATALVAGDGLQDIRQIVEDAPDYLLPGGTLLLEHGYDQAEPVSRLLQQRGFTDITAHQDLAGILRVTQATWMTP